MNYGVIISYMVSCEGLAIFHINSIFSFTSITVSGILALQLYNANAPSQPQHHGAPSALHLHLLHHGAPPPPPQAGLCVPASGCGDWGQEDRGVVRGLAPLLWAWALLM